MIIWRCTKCKKRKVIGKQGKIKLLESPPCMCCGGCQECCKCTWCPKCGAYFAKPPEKFCKHCKGCPDCCICKVCKTCEEFVKIKDICNNCYQCLNCCQCSKVTGETVLSKYVRKPVYLNGVIGSFYVLEDILTRITTFEKDNPTAFFRTDEKELAEYAKVVKKARDEALLEAANLYFDYIVLAAAGESRHSVSHLPSCTIIAEIKSTNTFVGAELQREGAYERVKALDPVKVLQIVRRMFHLYAWGGTFGGKPWGKIAEAGLMRGTVPDEVFLDHVVDLSHNGGLYINKPTKQFVYDHRVYTLMLTQKRERSVLDGKGPGACLHSRYGDILKQAKELKIVQTIHKIGVIYYGIYKPIAWGGKEPTLTGPLKDFDKPKAKKEGGEKSGTNEDVKEDKK